MKKKIIISAAAVLTVLVIAVFGAAWYMLDYALTPPSDRTDIVKRYKRMYAEYPYMRPWVDSLKSAKALRDTFVTMTDGERHHAVYARGDSAAGRTAILVHGYTACCQICTHTASATATKYRWDGTTVMT